MARQKDAQALQNMANVITAYQDENNLSDWEARKRLKIPLKYYLAIKNAEVDLRISEVLNIATTFGISIDKMVGFLPDGTQLLG